MCSQNDDPSQHSEIKPLRAALDATLAEADIQAFLDQTYDNQWMTRPVEECRAELDKLLARHPCGSRPGRAASATDEGPDFCPDCGNVPGSQRWQKAHTRPAAPAALDVEQLSYVGIGSIRRCINPRCDVVWSQPHRHECGVGQFLREYAALSGEPSDDR